jgi:hypothetical protein
MEKNSEAEAGLGSLGSRKRLGIITAEDAEE